MKNEQDRTQRITVMCNGNLKREAKKEIARNGIDFLADGYLEIFELGLKEFKKRGRVKKNE